MTYSNSYHFSNYQQLANWLYSQYSDVYETIETKKERLEHIKEIIRHHNLLPQVPIITVTGTNGKGSTVHALSSILQQQGYRVASFTSPHLQCFAERFCIDSKPITQQALLAAFNDLQIQINFQPLNVFSILFLIALYLFQQYPLDFIILEVGVGGRFDPCNSLDAHLVILTQVALDHTQLLGETRTLIGFEKAELLRKNSIFICGDADPPPSVIDKTINISCQSFWREQQFGIVECEHFWHLWFDQCQICYLPKSLLHPSNLACAVLAAKILLQRFFSKTFFYDFLPTLQLSRRCQRFFYQEHEVIFDVAHNPAAVLQLKNFIATLPKNTMTIALFGAMQDKSISEMLAILTPEIQAWYFVNLPSKRSQSAKKIAELYCKQTRQQNPHYCFDHPNQAWQAMLQQTPANARFIVFGSFQVFPEL